MSSQSENPISKSTRETTDGSLAVAETTMAWINHLTKFQRNALFVVGMIVFLVPVLNIVMNHVVGSGHAEHSVTVLAAEGIVSAGFFVVGLSAMIPPLGIWILSRVFRMKYFKRG